MEIPPDILSELICDRCETYLKRDPVYQKQDGSTLCGPCLNPTDHVTINKKYELLAQLMIFPCKYKNFGCPEKMMFGNGETHESTCFYKQYLCPVSVTGKCDWLGQKRQFLEHCEQAHPDQVIKNPYTFTHDIRTSRSHIFLLNEFLNVCFLLYTKVCMTSGKIFHSVRFLGDQNEASTYSYILKVKRNDLMISKPGRVAPEGNLTLQEHTSLALNINSLLEFLDGFDNTIFSLTVKTACKNQSKGCTYTDLPVKCAKHEKYFCDFSSVCMFCKSFNWYLSGTLFSHYLNEHKIHTYVDGSYWYPKQCAYNETSFQFCFILSHVGTLLCEWSSSPNNIGTCDLKIFTTISCERLQEYECIIKRDPFNTSGNRNPLFRASNYVENIQLLAQPQCVEDWSIVLDKNILQDASSRVCIKVNKMN